MPVGSPVGLTGDTRVLGDGTVVTRIRATADFDVPGHPVRRVSAGEIGGFVESLDNLGPAAWVADDAVVRDHAHVSGSVVSGRAIMADHARARSGSRVGEDAVVRDEAVITASTVIGDSVVDQRGQVVGSYVNRARVTGTATLVHERGAVYGAVFDGRGDGMPPSAPPNTA